MEKRKEKSELDKILDGLDRSCWLVMDEYIKQNCMKILEENWNLKKEVDILANRRLTWTAILIAIMLLISVAFQTF
jgi:hypothetical protein